jgi:hypothetical protein
MSINYNYSINTVKKINENGFENAVVQVYWSLVGTNESGQTSRVYGTSTFSTNELNSNEDFIPFDQVSDETIVSWIQNSVSEEQDTHMKNLIQQEIGV